MIHTLSNSALGKKWQLFWQEKKGRSEVRVTGPHVIADGTSVVAGSAQGLLGHHLSALQWEASSPAGARPLLWMWQLAAQPACKTTTGRTSSPTPSLPQWAEPPAPPAPCERAATLCQLLSVIHEQTIRWSEHCTPWISLSTFFEVKPLQYERNLW